MRLISSTAAALAFTMMTIAAAVAQPGPAAQANWVRYPEATELALRDVAGLVRIVPQDRADIAVSMTNPGPLPGAELRASGDRLIIDGKLRRAIRSCRVLEDGDLEVDVSPHGQLRRENLPVFEIRVPREAVISVGGAVRLFVGQSDELRLRLSGCGDADIEQVDGDADIALSGTPDVRLYEAESVRLAIAGTGDAIIGVVRDGLTASIAGAGDLTAAHLSGDATIAVQGAGNVLIRDGRIDQLSVVIAGAGDVIHNGVAERLDATIVGGGDVRVRRVVGEVNRRVIGGGEVVVSQR